MIPIQEKLKVNRFSQLLDFYKFKKNKPAKWEPRFPYLITPKLHGILNSFLFDFNKEGMSEFIKLFHNFK